MVAALPLLFWQEQCARGTLVTEERPTAFVHFRLFCSQDLPSGFTEKSFCLFLSMIGNKNSSLGMGFGSLLNYINQEGWKVQENTDISFLSLVTEFWGALVGNVDSGVTIDPEESGKKREKTRQGAITANCKKENIFYSKKWKEHFQVFLTRYDHVMQMTW